MQTFYPGNALWLIAPADAALKWSLVLHLLLGGWGAYRLTRELGATRAGGALAALVFGLQGQHVVFAFGGWTQVIAPIGWAPVILWQLMRAHARQGRDGWRAAAAAGLALGLQLLSGHPEWVRYTLFAGATLTLVGRGDGVALRGRLMRAATAVLIGVLVGLPQLGPTAQAVRRLLLVHRRTQEAEVRGQHLHRIRKQLGPLGGGHCPVHRVCPRLRRGQTLMVVGGGCAPPPTPPRAFPVEPDAGVG